MKELPTIVENRMQQNVNVEVNRIRNELQFQTNLLSEQLMNIKVYFKDYLLKKKRKILLKKKGSIN